MDKLILQTLEKHIEDLSHESPQGIDIDSIDQLKYELINLFSLHIVSQRSELLAFAKELQNIGFNAFDDAEKVVDIYLKANCG